MKELSYRTTEEFEKDLATLKKRFSTLDEDLTIAQKVGIRLFHLQGIDNKGIFKIPGLQKGQVEAYELKKFVCRSLKGKGAKSGIRIIYAFSGAPLEIVFIEMYFKGDKEREDRRRIQKFFKGLDLNL